jgi:hypothetical protein
MAVLNLPLLVLAVDATLVATGFIELDIRSFGLLGPGLSGLVAPVLAVIAAATGLVCGLALPGPRRLRPVIYGKQRPTVTASPDLSHGAVMERLRKAQHIPAAAAPRDDVWFDETGDDHPSELEPLEEDERRIDYELEEEERPTSSGIEEPQDGFHLPDPEQATSELPDDEADDAPPLFGEDR